MKTAVLLVNLGTPDSYQTKDVRKYLSEFLNDPRVIDLPFLSRKLLVNLIIVPFRSPKSAALYQKIWMNQGSPLLHYSIQVQNKLQQVLGDSYVVELAMRYQSPSLETAIKNLRKQPFKELIVLPLFPQYASASTGTVQEKIMKLIRNWQVIPNIRFISSFFDFPPFIRAWTARGSEYEHDKYDHILFSFHGLPERQIRKADNFNACSFNDSCCSNLSSENYYCYRAQCFYTARKIAESLKISSGKYTVSFQSRLGKDPWIRPHTDAVIENLAMQGKKKLLVFAPAFVSDCLETVYEISEEYDVLFKKYGGEKLKLVESLNDHPAWIQCLKELVVGAE